MKGPKYHEMNQAELEVEARDKVSELWKLRFQAATGQTEGLRKVRSLKRSIARIKTVIRERDLMAQERGAAGGGEANG